MRNKLAAIDRRAGGRCRCTAIDEQFLPLHMCRVVGRQEQHRLRDVIGFTDASERRGLSDPLLERFLGLGRCDRSAPDRGAHRATTLTRMLRGDSSDAITRAIARTPALLAA